MNQNFEHRKKKSKIFHYSHIKKNRNFFIDDWNESDELTH